MDLLEIRQIVRDRWQFLASKYPDLEVLTGEPAIRFARTHVLKHMMKSMGSMAEIEEAADHGSTNPNAKERMRVLIGKTLVNLMQLAESYGISDEDLARSIRDHKG